MARTIVSAECWECRVQFKFQVNKLNTSNNEQNILIVRGGLAKLNTKMAAKKAKEKMKKKRNTIHSSWWKKTLSSRAVQKCTKCCTLLLALALSPSFSLSRAVATLASAVGCVPERQLEQQQTDLWHMLMSPVRRTLCVWLSLALSISVSSALYLSLSLSLVLQLVWKIIPRGSERRREEKANQLLVHFKLLVSRALL